MNSAVFNSPQEREAFEAKAREMLVERLYNECAVNIQLVSKARAGGLLDVDTKTVDDLPIPKVRIGKLIKYRLRDISAYLDSVTTK